MKRITHAMGVLIGIAFFLMTSCSQTDVGLTTKVKAKLIADTTVNAYQIDVETKNGVVTLTGNIDNMAAKDRAVDLAKDTAGVRNVVDMISVRTAAGDGDAPDPHRTVGEVIDDAGITVSVKSQLFKDPDVKGLRIDVDTRDGVVFLTGEVRSKLEENKAIELAKQTKGVRDVRANLTLSRS